MANEEHIGASSPLASSGGYFWSFIVFAGITALWVFLVRTDDFYDSTSIFGVQLPATTLFYLLTMPAIGFLAGQWRFYQEARGLGSVITQSIAQALQFLYSHILITLFTVAMVTRTLFEVNIDPWVESLDDQLFVIASRFAPWLAAYLAGFNLGRALGLRGWVKRQKIEAAHAAEMRAAEARAASFAVDAGPVAQDAGAAPDDPAPAPHEAALWDDADPEPRAGDWRFPAPEPAHAADGQRPRAASAPGASGNFSFDRLR